MREVTLEESIRLSADSNRRLQFGPGERTNRTWPICLTCGQEVDSAKLENVNNTSCEIRATHHGKEDAYKITWPIPVQAVGADILEDPNVGWAIRRALADGVFFETSHSFNFSSKR